MPTYSIVIPVFNAERYLESCIESVLSQKSAYAYEVILINDGSTDQSPQICDRYAQQSSCVKVIHQVNQGVSAARNAGISVAKGMYLLFLDADDYWDSCFLQTLDTVTSQSPDLIEFGYCLFCDDVVYAPDLPAVEASGITGIAYLEAHNNVNCMPIVSSCAAAFRRQFLKNYDLQFPLGVTYGEDFDFHMHCLKYAKSVSSIDEPLYWYRINEASATHTPTVKKIGDMLSACARMYRLFPYSMLANYYCMKIIHIATLTRKDAKQLNGMLWKNRDILWHASGRSARIARVLYKLLGWYYASRLIQFGVNVRYAKKG